MIKSLLPTATVLAVALSVSVVPRAGEPEAVAAAAVPAPTLTLSPSTVVGTGSHTISVSDRTIYSTSISAASVTVVGSNVSSPLSIRTTGSTICPTPPPTAPPTAPPTTPPIILFMKPVPAAYTVPRQASLIGCKFGFEIYGSFTPKGLACGANRVQVSWQNKGTGTTDRNFATLRVLCPSISLDPTSGFAPNVPVNVTVTPSDFDPPGWTSPKTLTFDGKPVGTFGVDKPISFVAKGGCGSHTVKLTQVQPQTFTAVVANPLTLTASATYPIRCPSVAVVPALIARAAQPAPAVVTAAGFPANAAVSVTIDGAPLRGATTNGSGGLAAPVTINNLPCATYKIAVVTTSTFAGKHVTASAPFTVSCAALVTVDPGVVTGGRTTRVTGWGFTPGSTVTLVWKLPDGTAEFVEGSPQVATSDPDGKLDFFTLVLSNDLVGQRTLQALDTKGLSASTNVVVAQGTMQPSHSGSVAQRMVIRH